MKWQADRTERVTPFFSAGNGVIGFANVSYRRPKALTRLLGALGTINGLGSPAFWGPFFSFDVPSSSTAPGLVFFSTAFIFIPFWIFIL
jgi:hypothetical protein